MGTIITLDMIRAVRARVERSIPEARAALEASGGDVDKAIDALMTPLERKQERSARILPKGTTVVAPTPPPPPSNTPDHAPVFADLARVIAARGLWIGRPDPVALELLSIWHQSRFGWALPAPMADFLARWNGLSMDASSFIWGVTGHDRDVLDDREDPACADAFVIGDLTGEAHLYLREGGVLWIYEYEEDPHAIPLAPNLQSFFRDWLIADLDVLTVVSRARDRAERAQRR